MSHQIESFHFEMFPHRFEIFHILAESDTGEGARVLMDKYAALVSSLQR